MPDVSLGGQLANIIECIDVFPTFFCPISKIFFIGGFINLRIKKNYIFMNSFLKKTFINNKKNFINLKLLNPKDAILLHLDYLKHHDIPLIISILQINALFIHLINFVDFHQLFIVHYLKLRHQVLLL